MKTTLQVITSLLLITLTGCDVKLESGKETYICTMDPEVKSDKPGDCPVCGMKLVKASSVKTSPATASEPVHQHSEDIKATTAEAIYTCSMHPQIRQPKPGKCPMCGMNLVPAKPSEAAGSADGKVQLMPSQNSIASIVTEKATAGKLSHHLEFFGEIAYVQDSHKDFTWFYSGRVEKVLINYNTSEVSEGQPLIELYSEDAIMDQEKYLQALRDRYLTTFYERSLASAQVETIRARLLRAGFTSNDLEALVKKKRVKTTITINAPCSGTIIGSLPHVGERLASDGIMFHIVNLDHVWFVAKVFEKDMNLLKIGESISIETKAHPEKSYTGKLVFIDRMLDPLTRTVQARYEVHNPKHQLLPQLSATGKITSAQGGNQLLISASAIIDTGKRKVVYVKTAENTYEPREVKTGMSGQGADGLTGDRVEVLSGIKADEDVVISGVFLIDAEAQLRK